MNPYIMKHKVESNIHNTAPVQIPGERGTFRKLPLHICLKTVQHINFWLHKKEEKV